MKNPLAGILIPGASALVGIVAVVLWAGINPIELEARVPGLDRPKLGDDLPATKPLVGRLTNFGGVAAKLPGTWPRFRGERYDGIAEPGLPLAREWPSAGPAVLWSIELGEGHAGAAVRDGRVYVLDYNRAASADARMMKQAAVKTPTKADIENLEIFIVKNSENSLWRFQ